MTFIQFFRKIYVFFQNSRNQEALSEKMVLNRNFGGVKWFTFNF